MIFNIQRYSTHDGEGIRTIIFYKGCPLRCKWCSNPESQSFTHEILYNERLCRKLGDCVRTAPGTIKEISGKLNPDRGTLKNPESLRNVCMTKALTIAGENKSVPRLVHEIEKDIPFYRQSNGGVTLSGGEPLAQDEDLRVLLKELKKTKINVSVETSLHVDWKKISRCLGYIDVFLVDLKHIDPEKFREFTSGNATLVLKNLEKLAGSGEQIIIRIPVIPDFNHSAAEMHEIIDYAAAINGIREVHFIPYHKLGIEKYQMLGRSYEFGNSPSVEHPELKGYIEYAQSKGLKTRIGG